MLKKFIFFGVAGVIGFAVDTQILYLLKTSMGLYGARVASFVCAVFVTWNFNRLITFRHFDSGLKKRNEFFAYFLLMLGGGFVNYLVYAVLVTYSAGASQSPIIAVAAGSLSGMIVNYFSSLYLYRHSDNDSEEIDS